ncbi:MAG: MFS transporter [bacterium]
MKAALAGTAAPDREPVSEPAGISRVSASGPDFRSRRRAASVPLRVKLLYGAGDVANSVKMVLFGLFTLYFYTTVMGLPAKWVGVAAWLVIVWDAAIDPFIGHFSDRTASPRWGRRHLMMLVGALLMGVLFASFFAPPRGLSPLSLFLWFLGTSLAFRTASSLYGIPYYALGAELSQDYYERSQITGLRSAWGLIGTLCAATLPFLLFFPDVPGGADPKLRYEGYPAMGLAFGLAMTVAGLLAWSGTWPFRSSGDPAGLSQGSQQSAGLFRDVVTSLKNRSFRAMLLGFSLFFLGVVLNGNLSLYYLTHYVRIESSKAISVFHLAFYAGALVGVCFWTPLSKRTEKKPLCLLSTLLTTGILCGSYVLFGEGHLFGVGRIVPLALGNAMAGFFASILWILPPSMIADVTDEDACSTGKRREGNFFGIFYFGQQIAGALAMLLGGVLAEEFAGLAPGQVEPSAETVRRLAMIYGPLPAGILLVSAVLVLRYSLDRQKVEAFQKQLLSDEEGLLDARASGREP